jgi:hypothetical protein
MSVVGSASIDRVGGLSALLEIKPSPGHPPAIPRPVLLQLHQRSQPPESFPSYNAIQQGLADHFQLDLSYSTVHYVVRYPLKAKLKSPHPYSQQRDEQAEHHLKKTSRCAHLHQSLFGLEFAITLYLLG